MALSRLVSLHQVCNAKNLLSVGKLSERNFLKTARQYGQKKNNCHNSLERDAKSIESPFQNYYTSTPYLKLKNLWKPLAFAVLFGGAVIGGTAIWEYETLRSNAQKKLKKPYRGMKRQIEDKKNELTKQVTDWWNKLSSGEKVFVPICALNVLVFCLWRVPRFQPFMIQYFSSSPGSRNVCLPMILSTFSHYSGIHLLANMFVLHSFSTSAAHSLGKEQFLGLYLCSGVFSSFTSYIYKVAIKQPGFSLGASGAIMGILGYVCTQHPDTKLGIIFLPMITFSAGHAIKFIMGLDALGCALKWKFFDHAAHLGGATFGILWALWGNQYVWQKREPILQRWHEFRGQIK